MTTLAVAALAFYIGSCIYMQKEVKHEKEKKAA